MFNDFFKTLQGHFYMECLDKDNNVIDKYEEHNMIMTDARKSMAEIFANLDGIKHAHRLTLGTMGYKDDSIFIPKDEAYGFTKSRDRLFCEPSKRLYNNGDIITTLLRNDIVSIVEGEETAYYLYKGNDTANVLVSDETFASESFTRLKSKPYSYSVDFTLPGFNVEAPTTIYNANKESLDQIGVVQKDTSVIFTFVIDMESGNEQFVDDDRFSSPSSLFNEACIVVNDRIFCMKTFPSKIKDDSIKFKIIWTITF